MANDVATFTCEHCGRTFLKGWSDEEADAEYGELFADAPDKDDRAVVCDDCFKEMTGQYAPSDFVADQHAGRSGPPVRIVGLWAWVFPDSDGNEGIPAPVVMDERRAMMATDPACLDVQRRVARELARQYGEPIQLRYWPGNGDVVETIEPEDRSSSGE